ncbi:MAG: undecaprenyl-diphosphate phosphatase [Lentimicrobiaceae bacterium]|nr:undecaprenyl-diphosphate phosphatase [Lentimicrobiaceae bacterium]MCO5265026.1 undecaprenyl-diphosphate phosphatase [Lentimicrobium sp.]
MNTLQAIIIAIVEGITEFLPVSSTGHMIITQELLGIKIDDFVKAFTVNIQFGAILSVIVLYWKRFFQTLDFYFKLFVAFLPAAVIGFLLSDFIDSLLENVVVVAVMLVLGGIVLVFVDKWFKNPAKDQTVSYPTALKIGFFQCIAMIPGVSRSAATIIGGMTQKLDRRNAAEFSFFLAVPTMFAAAGYKLLQNYQTITSDNIDSLLIGNAVAFVVALIAIKSFIAFLTKYGFKVFGYYRIIVGLIILAMLALGYDLNIA